MSPYLFVLAIIALVTFSSLANTWIKEKKPAQSSEKEISELKQSVTDLERRIQNLEAIVASEDELTGKGISEEKPAGRNTTSTHKTKST